MNDFIVTGIERDGGKFLAAAFYEERQLTELAVMPSREESQVGKIYVGYIESVAKNIGGAFIRISKDFKCFLPNYKRNVHAAPAADAPEKGAQVLPHENTQGHMLVRITKDAAGVKEAVCSTVIELAGKYSVVSPGKTSLSFSKKLDDEGKALLKKWVNPHDYPGMHILLRTNSLQAEKKDILHELDELSDSLRELLTRASSAKPGECLYTPEPFYITMMRDLYVTPDRAFSDVPKIADALRSYMNDHIFDKSGGQESAESGESNPCLIRPGTLTLAQLYNLEHDLDRLSQKIVWLKSGAYLVIEQTEAFVIIDVNTGRCTRGKVPEETYRKINLEAGEEILRQLRLRELSGMILIDFINLESEDHREELVNVMKKRARKEHRKTEVIDLTKLGILEMIREKKGKPLDETLSEK